MKKAIIVLLLAISTSFSYGQITSLPKPEAYFSAIIVSDIEASITWYSKSFGFTVINKVASEERGFKQANLQCGKILIELIELTSSVSPKNLLKNHPKKTKIDGFFKFGFLVSEFEKWVTHLKQLEVEFYGSVVTDPNSKKRMLLVKDPDGNRIQLFEK